MDIEEMKKYVKNKIEADDLTKQVRQRIKENTWDKQNKREGFSETFKPLISQFEKPGDEEERENIFTQNQEMLRNQLALTKGLEENQKAITQGFSQFERLADIRDLPKIEDNQDEEDPDLDPIRQKKILKYNLEKNLNDEDKEILNRLNYPQPNELLVADPDEIKIIYEMIANDARELGNKVGGFKRTKNLTEKQKKEFEIYKTHHNTQKKYKEILQFYLNSLQYKVGQGLYSSPQELLHRFELLNGSLAAGNNGVLPEFIQIAHRLRDLGIITNNQLNKLLRKSYLKPPPLASPSLI